MKTLFLLTIAMLQIASTQAQKRPKNAAPTPKMEQGVTAVGKRVGKWNFYDRAGGLDLTFDYDSSRIIFQQPDTTRYLVRVGEQWLPKILARAPHFLGSTDQHVVDVQRKLRYPISSLSQQLQGTVLLSYTVGINGHTQDYTVENSLSPDCDQEVWRTLKELPDTWIPAVYLGRAVPARFYLAVQFRIMDEAAFNRIGRDEKQPAPLVGQGLPTVAAAPSRPRYTHELFVTAVGIERSSRTQQLGR